MVIEYADLECPYCAKAHLWERARLMGLDLERFETDRRSAEAADRVERDFRSGIRAGVATTPTQFVNGMPHPGVPDASFTAALRSTR